MLDAIEIVKPQGTYDHLDSCPFCGHTEIVYLSYDKGAGLRWRVTCCGCMATIDPGYAQKKHTVQQMWNRRSEREGM